MKMYTTIEMLGSVRFERSISCSTKAKCIQSKKK